MEEAKDMMFHLPGGRGTLVEIEGSVIWETEMEDREIEGSVIWETETVGIVRVETEMLDREIGRGGSVMEQETEVETASGRIIVKTEVEVTRQMIPIVTETIRRIEIGIKEIDMVIGIGIVIGTEIWRGIGEGTEAGIGTGTK